MNTYKNDIHKIISKIYILDKNPIVDEKYYLIDYVLYNDFLYLLYSYENNMHVILLKYNIYKFHIVSQITYLFNITGCFNKDVLYLINQQSKLVSVDLNTFSYINKYDIDINLNGINSIKLYCVNNNIYLCIVKINNSFIINNLTEHTVLMRDIENPIVSFYQSGDNIYLNNYTKLYIFNTITNSFSTESYDNEYALYENIISISKSCALINNKLYNYKNNTVTILNYKPKEYSDYVDLATIDSNLVKDNIYVYDDFLLILTYGTLSEANDDNNIILTNGIDRLFIPKNILIERSLFFKDMVNDVVSQNFEITFPLYDNLDIYLEYIRTNIIDNNKIDDLFNICLFIDDIDLEHLTNYIISKNNNHPKIDYDWIKSTNYIQLFYTNHFIKQYYQLINNLIIHKNFDKEKFLKFLKQTQTSSDSVNFYITLLKIY